MASKEDVLPKGFWQSKTMKFNVLTLLVTVVTFLVDNDFFVSNPTAATVAGVVVTVGNIGLRFITSQRVQIGGDKNDGQISATD